jgi:nitrate reductase delta subunit
MPSTTETTRPALKFFSVLLGYPGDDWFRDLSDWSRAAQELFAPEARLPLDRFFSWARAHGLLHLQERYTEAFDVNPATSMDLTYHCQGESEDRGKTLSRLRGIYRSTGLACTTAELPDHLPLVLEFLSATEDGRTEVLALCAPGARRLAQNLRSAKSPYADLVEPVSDILSAMSDHREKESRS